MIHIDLLADSIHKKGILREEKKRKGSPGHEPQLQFRT